MLRIIVAVSAFAGELDVPPDTDAGLEAAERMPEASGWDCTPEAAGSCVLMSGWVCCIFTVAFGRAGAALFGWSLGRLIRAVSFFGEAGLATMPDAPGAAGGCAMPDGGAAGFSGMVGLPESGGGFGGGVAPLSGLESGGGAGGAEGRLIGGGGGMMPDPVGRTTLDVSFFGD